MTADRDAVLARTAALERALEEERRRLDQQRTMAAALERRIASLAPSGVERPRTSTASVWRQGPAQLILVLALFGVGFVLEARTRSHATPGPVCTLRTDPPGARIYVGRAWGAQLLGTSPLTMTRRSWFQTLYGRVEARMEGYRSTRVWSPWDGDRCDDRTYRLPAITVAPDAPGE